MSVAPGTLTETFRSELLTFYGDLFGWEEIVELRRSDRLTLAVGNGCYVNVRERHEVMVCSGYEHFGLLVPSPEAAEVAWARLDADGGDVALEPIARGDDGYRSFRFRYLLPLTVEVQHFP
jgi:catechol 2,3-dioxygenase-like lactoylglutathione lyase family enzyme